MDAVRMQKERERGLREREIPFGAFTLREKTVWWNQVELDNVLAALSLPSGCRLLDVGCSDGRLIARLRERGRGDISCVGTDFALNPLKAMLARNLDVRAVCADAADSVFKPGIFDAVAALQVLHHLPSRDERLRMLKGMFDALCPGGGVALSVLNRPSWAGLVADGIEGPLLSSPELFVHLYDPDELRAELVAVGFRVSIMTGINNFPVRYLKPLRGGGVMMDMAMTRWLGNVSLHRGRYLLAAGRKP